MHHHGCHLAEEADGFVVPEEGALSGWERQRNVSEYVNSTRGFNTLRNYKRPCEFILDVPSCNLRGVSIEFESRLQDSKEAFLPSTKCSTKDKPRSKLGMYFARFRDKCFAVLEGFTSFHYSPFLFFYCKNKESKRVSIIKYAFFRRTGAVFSAVNRHF